MTTVAASYPTAHALLTALNRELILTRPFLERLPDGKFDWQPHSKSMPLGKLASHLTDMLGNINDTLTTDSYDLNTAASYPPPAASRAEVLARFQANATAARTVLTEADEQALAYVWVMTYGDQIIIRQPRAQIVRELLLDHIIHHRAQLGVYLRMLDIPVPGTYGATADEPEFNFQLPNPAA